MPLFIDRLPFHCWIDGTRTPPAPHWTIVVPIMLAEAHFLAPPAHTRSEDWVLDTGTRGDAFAWRHHLIQAGLDPSLLRSSHPVGIRTVAGIIHVPTRDAALWLVSNLPGQALPPYHIDLPRGLPFMDTPALPDPYYQRPLVGIRALRRAGLRIEIDFAHDTISVWTPDSTAP